MIRFRLGQRWKRERSGSASTLAPVDAFGLELDGIELLPGASEEKLLQVVPDLAQAAAALAQADVTAAQVSLAEAHLELLLERQGTQLSLQAVSLGRPARVLRSPVRVELSDFTEAAHRCGRALALDLSRLGAPVPRRLERALRALESEPHELTERTPSFGYSFRKLATRPGEIGFWLWDPDGRGAELSPGGAALPSLMLPGEVELKLGADLAWQAKTPPFLFALELSRQAGELQAALEGNQERFSFEPGGIAPAIALDLNRHTATLKGRTQPIDPRKLLRNMFELGNEVALAFAHRHRAQNKNPYLDAMVRRCREGLSALRDISTTAGEPTVSATSRAAPQRPLPTPGKLKRLRFERAWEQQVLAPDSGGSLLLGRQGPMAVASEVVCALSRSGALRFRRSGAHGVAVHAGGTVLSATEDRIVCFEGTSASARWLHDHDGLPIGPWLLSADGLWVAGSEERGLVAFDRLSGRERWRLVPPRTQRLYVALHGGMVWVAADSGTLFGLSPDDGQPRFRVRAPLPFVSPVQYAGKRSFALLGQGEQSGVVALDATAQKVAWTVELPLSRPAFLAQASRVWVIGETEEETRLYCLSATGKLIWDRTVPVGRGPFHLLPVGREVIAVGAGGAAVRVGLDGALSWRIGASNGTAANVAPSLVRSLLLLPGESVRAVDPANGHVLGEIDAGPGLLDAKADAQLTVYLLDDDGRLTAQRLATHLAIVKR